MTRTAFDHIPGLFVFDDYFTSAQCEAIVRGSLGLSERLEAFVTGNAEFKRIGIPQPEFVRSARHNLASDESYTRAVLHEAGSRELRCEYFPRYGEDGHALGYFRGNDNLPDFIHGPLLDGIRHTVEAEHLASADQPLTWKLTMNFYRSVGGVVAGFPFHVDIPANGVVTMILNTHREALFQIARGEVMQDVQLRVGSLLILSGESRYEWKHRVLPQELKDSPAVGGIERVSLVLGFQ